MSKVFQIVENVLFAYYPQYRSAKEASTFYSSDIVFVDAPDYVFDNWGYDETKDGDERFIRPIPPTGLLYDDDSGQFYPENEIPPSKRVDVLRVLTKQLQASTDRQEFLEDCIAEMAAQVYGEQEVK